MSEMTEMLANLLMQKTGKAAGYDITDPRDLSRMQEDEFDVRQRLKNKSIFNPQGMAPRGEDEEGNNLAGPPDPKDPQTLGDTWAMEAKQQMLREILEHAKLAPKPNPQIPLRGAQNLGRNSDRPTSLGVITQMLK
jgi:hypothetical protein